MLPVIRRGEDQWNINRLSVAQLLGHHAPGGEKPALESAMPWQSPIFYQAMVEDLIEFEFQLPLIRKTVNPKLTQRLHFCWGVNLHGQQPLKNAVMPRRAQFNINDVEGTCPVVR